MLKTLTSYDSLQPVV